MSEVPPPDAQPPQDSAPASSRPAVTQTSAWSRVEARRRGEANFDNPPRYPIKAAQALGKAIQLWLRNFVPLSIWAGIAFLPYAYLLQQRFALHSELGGRIHVAFFILLPAWVLAIVCLAAVDLVEAGLADRRASILRCLPRRLLRLPHAIGTALLAAIPDLLFFNLGLGWAMSAGSCGGIWLLLGLFALKTMIWCGLFVAIPVVIAERPGVFGALRRSWWLTMGSKWRLFAVMVLFYILVFVGLPILDRLFEVFLIGPQVLGSSRYTGVLVTGGLFAILGPLGSVYASVVYHAGLTPLLGLTPPRGSGQDSGPPPAAPALARRFVRP
jgi:hypothetical protein